MLTKQFKYHGVPLLCPSKMLLASHFPKMPLLLDKEFPLHPARGHSQGDQDTCYRHYIHQREDLSPPCTFFSGEYKQRRLDRLAGEGRVLPVDKAQALAGVPYGQKSKALPSSALARSNLLRQGPGMDQ